MNHSLQSRFTAILLAFLSVAAIVFGVLNYRQRSQFLIPEDGVLWLDSAAGVQAWRVQPGTPAARAGIEPGDIVETVQGAAIHRATQVTQQLWRAGVWLRVSYRLARNGEAFQAELITAPEENPTPIWNYLGVLALLYLFIGVFIISKRWTAPRAIHF